MCSLIINERVSLLWFAFAKGLGGYVSIVTIIFIFSITIAAFFNDGVCKGGEEESLVVHGLLYWSLTYI